jgi:HK97 family phage prohead protease
MNKEFRVLQFQPEVRAGADGKKVIAGYAVKWRSLSNPIWGLWLEQFERGAFAQSLTERVNDIYASWQHDVGMTLGRSPNTLTVREDDIGLAYEIDPPTWAAPQIESIERGDVRGSSFMFVATVEELDWDTNPDYVIRTVKRAELYEIAPVTLAAYPSSTAGVRSEDQFAEKIVYERLKRQQQFSDYRERERALRELSIRFRGDER